MRAKYKHFRTIREHTVDNFPTVLQFSLFFSLMVLKTWCGDLIRLLDCFGSPIRSTVQTHFFACPFMSLDREVAFAPHFTDSRSFSGAPAEIRDAKIFLYSSIILSFGLHPR